jgi:hypothetical protein
MFLPNMLFQKFSSKSMVDPPEFGAYTKVFFQNDIRNFIHVLFSICENKKIKTLPKEGPLISLLEPITIEFKTTIKLSWAK